MPGFFEVLFHTKTRPAKAPAVTGDLPFTLADIRAAVPPELFKASLVESWYYIVRDFALFGIIGLATNFLLGLAGDSWLLRSAIWLTYVIVQGATAFGVWVIGHECGHQGYFGDGHWLNTPVGYVLHTLYCTPFHSWRITHATHHRYTNNKELDTAFPPKDYPVALFDAGESFPPLHLLYVLMYLMMGWPMYVLLNLEGHRYEKCQSHFDPNAPMFTKRERMDVIVSDIGVAVMLSVLAYASYTFGLANVACWYGLAWVGSHGWLVLVTFLQHSDARVPHYEEDENFTFVKGAVATVDRDYGALFNNLTHHITDAHMVHHVFSRIPFYQAKKATPYVAKVIGKYYVRDERPFFQQLWEAWWSHQSSFFDSRAWQAKHPGKDRLNTKVVNE